MNHTCSLWKNSGLSEFILNFRIGLKKWSLIFISSSNQFFLEIKPEFKNWNKTLLQNRKVSNLNQQNPKRTHLFTSLNVWGAVWPSKPERLVLFQLNWQCNTQTKKKKKERKKENEKIVISNILNIVNCSSYWLDYTSKDVR